MASSLAAVRGAEEAGATHVPNAALHVKLAQEELQQAKQLMEDDKNLRAEDKAMRAEQDAELALLLTRRSAAAKKLAEFTAANASAGGVTPAAPAVGP